MAATSNICNYTPLQTISRTEIDRRFQAVHKALCYLSGISGGTLTFDNIAPPTTNTPSFTSFYGGNTIALGDPNAWSIVTINGIQYLIPMYLLA